MKQFSKSYLSDNDSVAQRALPLFSAEYPDDVQVQMIYKSPGVRLIILLPEKYNSIAVASKK